MRKLSFLLWFFPAAVFLCSGTSFIHASPVDVPVGRSFALSDGPLLLKLDEAEIHLYWDAEKQASLSYSTGFAAEDVPSLLSFEHRRSTASEIFRSEGATEGGEDASETIILNLHLLPSQLLEIRGRDLDINARASNDADVPDDEEMDEKEDEKEKEQAAEAGGSLNLDLLEGLVELENLSLPCKITARQSNIEILRPRVALELQTTGGDLKVIEAAAPLQVMTDDGRVFIDSGDSVTMTMKDARVSMKGVFRSLGCEAVDSYLEFYQTGGNLNLSGSGSTFRFVDVHLGQCEIAGDSHSVSATGRAQLFRTRLSNSVVEVPQWQGRIETTLRMASSCEISSLEGDLLFYLYDDSELNLQGITGHLRGQSHESSMVFDNLRSMEVDIWSSHLRVSALREITKLNAYDSESEISAPALRSDASISLQEGSSLELEMPAPCILEVKNPIDDWSSVIDAPNCGLRVNGQLTGNLSRAHRGGPKPVQAEVSVDDSSNLQVEVPL